MDTGGESGGLGGLGGQGNGGERTAFILFTDIYRSSHLWEVFPKQYPAVLEQHNRTVEEIVLARSGDIIRNLGDGYAVLFDDAVQCADSAVAIQCAMAGAQALPAFSDGTELQVRVACHGGELRQLAVGRGYFGPPLNRASRICQVCHPGQALVSQKVQVFLDAQPVNTTLIDLGEHRLRDLAEPEHLFQLDHPGFALHEFPPLPTLASRPNNLIEQPNAFIGRAGELAELKEMLVGQAVARLQRLITITAPGGYGKSRLATQLCADLLEEYKHGVFEVLLAPVGDHNRIVGATADALGFQFYGKTDPEEQLIDYLREKELLISFDNFEHVMEGAELISSILKEAPRVQVVVTSREPLRLSVEKVKHLEPLPVGDKGTAGEEELPGAVSLFVDRAALVKDDFALTPDNLPTVQGICERLDGVPLAIELAAAWADSYSLDELLSEMNQQLELTARMRDVPERHRSVRASLDWSFGLLSDEQRDILRCLAVFKGGFFIEAAEAVLLDAWERRLPGSAGFQPAIESRQDAGAPRPDAGKMPALPAKHLRRRLAELCDKSWLFTREVASKTRFFIRDAAAREYAWEKPRQSPDYESAVIAHVRNFAELMEQEGEKLHGPGQLEALNALGLELENIYKALDTALNRLVGRTAVPAILESRTGPSAPPTGPSAPPEAESLLLPFVKYLYRYLDIVSRFLEALGWYERLVESAERTGNRSLQILARLGYGGALLRLSRYDEAIEASTLAKRLAEEEGDRESIALALNNLGLVAYSQGRYDEQKELHAESLAISREIGDRYGIASSLNNLGLVAQDQGRYEEAMRLHEESLAIRREIGDRYGTAGSLNNVGLVAGSQGRCEDAKKLYGEALVINRELGNQLWISFNLGNLGLVAHDQGRYDEAKKLHEESLTIEREIGDRIGIAMSLMNLGLVAHAQGHHEKAKKLHEESLAICREIGSRKGVAGSMHNIAAVAESQGHFVEAEQLLRESEAISREIGERDYLSNHLILLARVTLAQHRHEDAKQYAEEALQIKREIGDHSGMCESLAAAGNLLVALGRLEHAAAVLYGAQHHAEQLGHTFGPTVQAELDEGLKKVQGERMKDEGWRMKGKVQEKKGTGESEAGGADFQPAMGSVALRGGVHNGGQDARPTDLEQLKAQACAMSLDELVAYALAALAELKLETPR
ncbi:tetratricopeptide repeat protein [bacterium]|nr:tetratricopeptide repeat protein [bacterium]